MTALGLSSASSLRARLPDVPVTVFGYRSVFQAPGADGVGYCGACTSRRWWNQHSWHNIRLVTRFPLLSTAPSNILQHAAAICDLSGGDSFTDLYGHGRYSSVTECKRFAIDNDIPLILLPQTYGPFTDGDLRDDAASLCAGATQAWARDARSFEILRELLGDAFDASRHRQGVDVAFLLPKVEPREEEVFPAAYVVR